MADVSPGYCTLSHCWGQTQPLKLTRDSYEGFEENIPFELLPKTFADAIHITLNLGVSYLWIDSLCICQDDQGDWLAESARMGDIYANGICNIAALDHGGCFFDGPTPASKALYFSTRGKLYLTTKFSQPNSKGGRLSNTPLGKRGWIFQELVLSPRTIFYGPDGMSWACVQEEADEVHSMRQRMPYTKVATGHKSTFAHFRSPATESFHSLNKPPGNELWSDLVSKYTDTVLSYESDKWLAISGLARRYVESSGRKIVAGLHWDRLLEELAWWSDNPAGRILNGAPTWSWLSCKSKVDMRAAEPSKMLATMVALPDERLATRTWHIMYGPSSPTSTTTQVNRYPIKISGYVRSFCYTTQKSRSSYHESFDANFEIYTIMAETIHIWLDIPLEDGTTVWGVAHSWSWSHPELSMILFVPASHDEDCWRRVGMCRVRLSVRGCRAPFRGFLNWDNPQDRETFLQAFGSVKELTIV
ncbi:MAG: hypothetical protein Q9221_006166 [Calogaya cf. arnoldii]